MAIGPLWAETEIDGRKTMTGERDPLAILRETAAEDARDARFWEIMARAAVVAAFLVLAVALAWALTL
jgi:hypothetical protein